MIRSYIKTAIRYFRRQPTFTAINTAGLAMGVASFLIIALKYNYETSFDKFHTDSERIYRIVRQGVGEHSSIFRPGISFPLTNAIRDKLSSVEHVGTAKYSYEIQLTTSEDGGASDKKFVQSDAYFVEPEFFSVVDFGANLKWLQGNPQEALKNPLSVVLTKSVAEKAFTKEDIVGESIKINNGLTYTVTGVIADLPINTDFPFKVLMSYSSLLREGYGWMDSWSNVSDDNHVYVKLKEGVTQKQAEQDIALLHESLAPEIAKERLYILNHISALHHDARFLNFNYRVITENQLLSFLAIGFFILLTACINFINLTTAQAIKRSKEVGLRKVLGSNRKQLILQHLGETFVLVIFASIIGLGLAEMAMLFISDLLQIQVETAIILQPIMALYLVMAVVVITIAAGIYPASRMLRFSPIQSVNSRTLTQSGGITLRRTLVVMQFVISQVFILGTIVVILQVKHFQSKDLGFKKDGILILPLPSAGKEDFKVFKQHLLTNSLFTTASLSSTTPSGNSKSSWFMSIYRPGMEENDLVFETLFTDQDFLPLYNIELLAGRNFQPSEEKGVIILSKNLVKDLGFESYEDALGATVSMGNDKTVVGVIDNYHSNSLREGFDYVGLFPNSSEFSSLSLQLSNVSVESINEALYAAEEAWSTFFPGDVFEYQFLDQDIAAFYDEERKLSSLFQLFSGLSIFIGCLGLIGLVAFMANQKVKEIGVRKVLGAKLQDILAIFGKEFSVLLIIAFIVSAPIAYISMQVWLQDYSERIIIGPEIFLLGLGISATIALLAISVQSFRAALADPISALRDE